MNHRALLLRFAYVTLTTGLRLHYAVQGHSNGHPIILLHGYTDSWFSFSRVLPRLPTSYRVYALDQRGHGDSDRPANGYGMRHLAADVLAFMDAMELAQASVVGHSMGSLVALELALAAPDRVARLVLAGSGTTLRNDGIFGLQQAVDAIEDPVPATFAREFQLSTIHHPVPDDFLATAVGESLKLPASVWRQALAGQLAVNYTHQLGRIQTPTLILRGERDTVFTSAAQDALATGLAATAVSKVYPQTGHALHWERPAEFVTDLQDFISEAYENMGPNKQDDSEKHRPGASE
jgi:pimeloyl-ACP methyl ester carboxylesterase